MSNKSDKAKQAELKKRAAALDAEATGDRAALRAPGEIDSALQGQSLDWFKFLKDPNRDFSKTPGMAFNESGEEGAAAAEGERTALGSMQFGTTGADPNLQAVLKANIGERRAQRRGQSLESAVGRYDQLMRATASDVASRDLSRRMGLAGTTTGASSNATNSWAAYQPRPHWGLSLLQSGIAGAAGIGAAMATGGGSAAASSLGSVGSQAVSGLGAGLSSANQFAAPSARKYF